MKKNILVTAIGFVLLCTSILYVSCRKSSPEKDDTPIGSSKPLATPPLSFTPATIVDGMLSFPDDDAYVRYQASLKDFITKDTSSRSEEEILDSLESAMGFLSLRKIAFDDFEAQNLVGWASPSDIPEEHWIAGKYERAVLNIDREVMVNNVVTHYVNKDFMAYVERGQIDILQQLRALPDNATLEDIWAIDPGRQHLFIAGLTTNQRHIPVNQIQTGGVSIGGPHIPSIPTPLGQWGSTMTYHKAKPCTNPTLVTFTGLTLVFDFAPNQGEFFIDYGDGQTETRTGNSGSNSSVVAPFQHYYGSAGIYTVKVYPKGIQPQSSNGNIVAPFEISVDVSQLDCSFTSKMQTEDYTISGTEFIRGHVKYVKWWNFFKRTDLSRVLAYTELYRNDGGWKRIRNKQTTLCTKPNVISRDASCNGISTYEEYDCDDNINQMEVEMKYDNVYRYKHVKSRHEVGFGGHAWGFDIQMEGVCPD